MMVKRPFLSVFAVFVIRPAYDVARTFTSGMPCPCGSVARPRMISAVCAKAGTATHAPNTPHFTQFFTLLFTPSQKREKTREEQREELGEEERGTAWSVI